MKVYQYRGKMDSFFSEEGVSSDAKGGLQYLASLLEFGDMKFSSPCHFNDPFDCRPTIFSECSDKPFPHAVGNNINQALQNATSTTVGVACFTTEADSMLMWSHYGDQHKSVCVGFDSDVLESAVIRNNESHPLYHKLQKVVYTNDRPNNDDRRCFFHKSLKWQYENEYRLISSIKKGQPMWGSGVWTIPKESICEIILGAKMHDDIKRMVVSMVKTIRPDLPIKISVPDMKTFDLHIEPLDSQPIMPKMSGVIMDANGQWKNF